MFDTQSGYVQVGGGKLYYEIAGEGETVVLAHAGFVDSGMWDGQWQALAEQYRVIRFDIRGYGKSDVATGPVCRREDLYQVLTALDVERAHLVGCSLGGEHVIDFALEHPEMVASLVIVSAVPSGFELQGDPPPFLFEMMGAVQEGNFEYGSELQIRIWVDGMFREADQVDADVRRHAKEMNLIAVKNGTMMVDFQPLNPLDPPAVGRLGELNVPALIIVGALDNPEILRAADVMAAEIKDAKKVILEDAAHVPNMERGAAFNQAVLEFLG